MTDRARPGLVAVYDIRPGNGAGQFLQPRSPHGASTLQVMWKYTHIISLKINHFQSSVLKTHELKFSLICETLVCYTYT